MADLDCCNPNCNNKAQSEDALTCSGCTLAMETTDAGICEDCKCWTETAECNPRDGTPACPACYSDWYVMEPRHFLKAEYWEEESHG